MPKIEYPSNKNYITDKSIVHKKGTHTHTPVEVYTNLRFTVCTQMYSAISSK